MAQLALDDDQRDALVGHLDRVSVGRTGDGHLRALRFVGVASERRRAPTAVRLSRRG